ncbi:MAG: putative primase/helicase [Solirubrobacteraceae bacterium]|jgi:putative DNA primase/helicase|nr:putative primase/helicase [Solirubrobacteraceae bacterium]
MKPLDLAKAAPDSGMPSLNGNPPAGRRIGAVCASTITARAMTFLARPWLPLGEITLIGGEPGLGKSAQIIYYAAKASRGELDGDLTGQPVDVLFGGTEENQAATSIPRAIAAGADLNRIHFLEASENGRASAFTIPDDLEQLEEQIAATGAKLVLFDPLSAFLSGKVNSWREHDVRRALAALGQVARDHDAAFVGTAHLNKGDADKLLQRLGGSIGFAAVARSVIAFGRDPTTTEPRSPRRIIAHAKCNVAPEADPLAASIEPATVRLEDGEVIGTSVLKINGASTVEADDLLVNRDDYTQVGEAADFLRAEMEKGPVPVKQLKTRADDAGLSWRTVERAKGKVHAKARKVGTGGWVWELPDKTGGGLCGVDGLQAIDPTNTAKAANTAKDSETGELSWTEVGV